MKSPLFRPRLAILSVALATSPVAAQPTPPEPAPQPAQPEPPPSWLPGILDWTDRPPPPNGQLTLTLDAALAIAVEQQPALRQSRATVEVSRGRVDQARVIRKPTVNLSASVATSSSRQTQCGDGSFGCGGFFDPTLNTGLGASVNYRIYDFGQTRANIRAAEATAEATAMAVDITLLDIRRDVEAAYLEAVARERLIRVAEATVKSEDAHLDQAKRFVAAQAKDPIEVAQAQARAATARSSLAQAQSNNAIALANLRAAIGWLDATRSPVIDPTWPEPPVDAPLDLATLVSTARSKRPELAQLDKQVFASEASLDAAKAQNRPVLSANGQVQWSPSDNDWTPEPSWNVGISLSWAVFDGGAAHAQQRIARANLASTVAQRDALLVSLTSQLDSARAQIVANRANVIASTEAITAARRQLQLADARYVNGLGSQIELADAQAAVTTAEGNLVLAQFQLAGAWVQLRRALAE